MSDTLNGVSLAETSSTTYQETISRHEMKYSREEDSCQRESNVRYPCRNLKNCPRNIKDRHLAYKSILRPKLKYANSVWDPYTAENINKLEGVQRCSARFVCNKYSWKESVTSMLDDLEWPPLQQRRAVHRDWRCFIELSMEQLI